tara:strand:+ start:278 stop:841 length:564 start_codon:yes stop_codon:yes gene_type:complete
MFHIKHQTHKETLIRFALLIGTLVIYTVYLSTQYSPREGLGLSFLTWSFFVLCTPIADGGFIIAFPLRLLFQIKMLHTQIVVWFIALGGNIAFLVTNKEIYSHTIITSLLRQILTTPWPYWVILGLCLLGTLLSIYFGDEIIDAKNHANRKKYHQHGFKYKIFSSVVLMGLVVALYYHLIAQFGLQI